MRHFKLTILALLCCHLLSAQTISPQARHFLDSVQNVLTTSQIDSIQIQAALNLGNGYISISRMDSAILFSKQALALAEMEENPNRKFATYNQMGQIQLRLGEYPKALIQFQNALRISEKISNPSAKTNALQLIGKVYEGQGQYEKALEHYQQGYEIEKEREGNIGILTFVLSNLANANAYLEKFDNALKHQLEALRLRKGDTLGDPVNLGYSYNDIAFVYSGMDSVNKALEYYRKAYTVFKPIGANYEVSIVCSNICDIFQQRGQLDSVFHYGKESLEAAKLVDAKTTIVQAARNLSNAYESSKDFSNAYQYLQMSMTYQDSVFNDDRARELGRLESRLELEQKEADNQKKQLVIEQQRKTTVAIGTGLVLVLGLLGLLFRSRKKIKSANEALMLRNVEINQQKEEILAQSENLKEAYEEIQQQKEEIYAQSETLKQTNEEVKAKNEILNERNDVIEQTNKKIISSINYASRIQTALLPFQDRIQKTLTEHFIILKPKDIVSGDFYWFEDLGNKVILAAVDCTGHGVPGAFMSMLGYGALDDAVLRQHLTEPDEILMHLDKNIQEILQQESTENKDGMDIAICVIDKTAQKMYFSGAKRPIVYFQNSEMHRIKGDTFGIGGVSAKKEKAFEKHEIDISIPTNFYLFSDGYPDQFGGEKGKKFMVGQFRKKLTEIHQLPISAQKTELESTLNNWMGDEYKQIDDILVIGGKLG